MKFRNFQMLIFQHSDVCAKNEWHNRNQRVEICKTGIVSSIFRFCTKTKRSIHILFFFCFLFSTVRLFCSSCTIDNYVYFFCLLYIFSKRVAAWYVTDFFKSWNGYYWKLFVPRQSYLAVEIKMSEVNLKWQQSYLLLTTIVIYLEQHF